MSTLEILTRKVKQRMLLCCMEYSHRVLPFMENQFMVCQFDDKSFSVKNKDEFVGIVQKMKKYVNNEG